MKIVTIIMRKNGIKQKDNSQEISKGFQRYINGARILLNNLSVAIAIQKNKKQYMFLRKIHFRFDLANRNKNKVKRHNLTDGKEVKVEHNRGEERRIKTHKHLQ